MRILLATIGSLGDLHPCLALGLELKRRGHAVVVASTEAYQSRVTEQGLGFHSLRPNWDPADSDLIRQCEDLKSGPEVLFRKLILPHLEDTYTDLLAAAKECDVMLAGELVYAAPLVAEKLRIRWASIILSPCSFLSAHDPSVLVNLPQLIRFRTAGVHINRAFLNIGTRLIRHWWEPVRRLRVKEGLRPECEPLTCDKFSPALVLALFPSAFAQPQPDWPAHTVQAGFTTYDGGETCSVPPELAGFLDAGEPPIVFTLGSTAVSRPGNFYQASAEAVLRLGKRAIMIGTNEFGASSPQIFGIRYAPYSMVFPRASVIVHQGGSGTTGQALRAGRPMLFVPFGWDQPDNAARVERLGAALSIARKEYSTQTACEKLERLLQETHFAEKAAALGQKLKTQNGTKEACDAVEALAGA
ncbi:MAG TPA: glycosyltransferase [Acidobacteriaceae bacterium]|jgi:UDP:flavonoid glycosyltransferase YjiC (YdhE family)